MDEIERLFMNVSLKFGGVVLYYPDDAYKVIKECRERNYPILGIDAFFVNGDEIQPTMEHSLDYTSSSYLQSSLKKDNGHWDEANEFIRSKANLGLMFEVVYELC